jgi:hypothetical protein
MRIVPVIAAVAVAVPALADADPAKPATEDTRELAGLFGLAMHHEEPTALRDLFAAKVTLEGIEFADGACDKKFGKGKRRTVAKKLQTKLAACMIKAGWSVPEQPSSGTDWISFESTDAVFMLNVAVGADGSPKISGLRLVEASGEEAGVADGLSAPPPPPPPQYVTPDVVEASRLTGDKLIVPDDATKTEITRSGKTKIVASYKMCLDDTGVVDTVTMLKSSGFPSYDQKLEAGMRSWTYKPFMVNGKAAPVCTAVTFIYSQK